MAEIRYIKGDATCPQAKGQKIIAHVCNNMGGWGKGFVLAISKRWREPEEQYRRWYNKGEDFALGNVAVVRVRNDISVCNMVAQKGFRGKAIRYDSLRECLAKLREEADKLGASVHMPRIGCGLAGGRWEEVEPIVREELADKGVSVTVYDYD